MENWFLRKKIAELEAEVSRLHSNGERHHVRYKEDVEYYLEHIEALQAEVSQHRTAIEKINRTSVSLELYDAVIKELEEIKISYAENMAEPCEGPDDRVHCTCVPVLRAEIKRLNSELSAHREAIEKMNRDSVSVELYVAVVEENNKLRNALRLAADEPNIDKARAIA